MGLGGLLSRLAPASTPDPQSSREAALTRGHRPFPLNKKLPLEKDKVPPFDFHEEGSGGQSSLLPAAGLCRKGPRGTQINTAPPSLKPHECVTLLAELLFAFGLEIT